MSASIVIPAHDEERVLGDSLRALLEGLAEDVQVVVVCNGCQDRTAEVARGFGPRVEVAEREEASKVGALNAGDALARGFPRLYLDADVTLSGAAAMELVRALEAPGALAAEPRPRVDTSGSSAAVRAYYAVWLALHGRRPGDVGGGLYALSAAGRARFDAFPAVISDDGFARAHFAPQEIARVDAESLVRAPRTLRALVRIKTRSRLGVLELRRRFPDLWTRKRAAGEGMGRKLGSLPLRLWPLAPLYAAVQLAVRRRARRQAEDLEGYRWERDESSRRYQAASSTADQLDEPK